VPTPGEAVRGRDGTIWVEARRVSRPNGTWRWIVRIDPDGGRRTSETGVVRLSHVGAVGRRGRATVATYIDRDRARLPDDTFGGVYVEFSNGGRRSVGIAGAPEYFVASAAPSVHRIARTFKGVVALGSYADLTEAFSYRRLRGGPARGLFDPTGEAPYNEPPLYFMPVLPPKRVQLSWLEGPDWSQAQERLVGNWKLVIANSKTGAESLRVWVGRHGEELHHADYDGRYWVGTFSKRMQRAPKPSELRVRVVDTRAENPRVIEAGCTTGFVASVDRFVKESSGVAGKPWGRFRNMVENGLSGEGRDHCGACRGARPRAVSEVGGAAGRSG
jgi:hypothetical protein